MLGTDDFLLSFHVGSLIDYHRQKLCKDRQVLFLAQPGNKWKEEISIAYLFGP